MFAHVELLNLAVLIFSTLPTYGHFCTLYLNLLGKISTAVSRDYAYLRSPSKHRTGRKLSRIFL